MGQWETGRGRGSDAMADILGEAIAEVGALPMGYTLDDLADAIEFVTRGMLVVNVHSETIGIGTPIHFKGQIADAKLFPTIPNRGQIKSETT